MTGAREGSRRPAGCGRAEVAPLIPGGHHAPAAAVRGDAAMIERARKIFPYVVAAAAALFVVYLWRGRAVDAAGRRGKNEIRLSTMGRGYSDLVVIAYAQKLFEKEGVVVKPAPIEDGKTALAKVVDREVDVAVIPDIPFAFDAIAEDRGRIIATVARAKHDFVVLARKADGISAPKDLSGKRVGVEDQLGARYLLGLFLKRHGLSEKDVTVVAMKPKRLAAAFAENNVAAIADGLGDRHAFMRDVRSQLGDVLVELRERDLHRLHVNLVTSKDFAKQNPELLRRFMRAMLAANDLFESRRDEAASAVRKTRRIDDEKLSKEWAPLLHEITLTQPLLDGMEEQARWFKDSGRGWGEVKIPSYADMLWSGALRELRPSAVKLRPP